MCCSRLFNSLYKINKDGVVSKIGTEDGLTQIKTIKIHNEKLYFSAYNGEQIIFYFIENNQVSRVSGWSLDKKENPFRGDYFDRLFKMDKKLAFIYDDKLVIISEGRAYTSTLLSEYKYKNEIGYFNGYRVFTGSNILAKSETNVLFVKNNKIIKSIKLNNLDGIRFKVKEDKLIIKTESNYFSINNSLEIKKENSFTLF